MKLTLNVKLVNAKFDQAYADKDNEGEETEDNIRFLWEDEFEVKGDVEDFKVINNTTYQLRGLFENDEEFCFEIPDMTVVECTMKNGTKTLIPFSKKAVSKTSKVESKQGFYFNVLLKNTKELVNPMEGVYIIKDDYPEELQGFVKNDEEE